jgi:hypothetical protein
MKPPLSFFLAGIFCILMSACASSAEASTSEIPQTLQPTAVSTVPFQIIKSDGSSVGITIADLKTFPLAQASVEGKVEEGPRLLDVLTFAGVTDFTEIFLTGSSKPATLTRGQVDDNTILDFTNHGTVKLATTYIPKPDWTKGVSRIEVKE